MDEHRQRTILAALLREVGRLEPPPQEGTCFDRSAAVARELLSCRPSLAPVADQVAATILGEPGEAAGSEPDVTAPAAWPLTALREDLDRIPDGPPTAFLASMSEVLSLYLSGGPGGVAPSLFDGARLRAAVADAVERAGSAAEPFLFVQGRLTGLDDHLFGAADPCGVAADVPTLVGRSYQIAALEGAIARRLLGVAEATPESILWRGGGSFLLLLPNSGPLATRLREELARLERDLLAAHQARIGCVVALVTAGTAVLDDASDLLERLAEADRDRARTPFLDALDGPDALGPFGSGMASEDQVRAESAGERELGQALTGARFGLVLEEWPPRIVPLADADALREAGAGLPAGVTRVECLGDVETLRSGLAVSAELGGRLALESAPVLPGRLETVDDEPIAVVRCRVAVPARERATLLEVVARRRQSGELVRSAAGAGARESGIAVFRGAGDQAVLVGGLRAILGQVCRLASRVDAELGPQGGRLDAGVAVCALGAAGPHDLDVTWPLLQAGESLARAGAAAAGTIVLLGAETPTNRLAETLALGDGLVELARTQPGPVAALLEAALRIGERGEDLPLSTVVRLKGRIHAIAAGLGVAAGDLRRSEPEADDSALLALRSLIRDFPRMFDSGAARAPLAYAVLLSKSHVRELRT